MTRNPTCAYCGFRDAETMFEGRQSCGTCARPVDDIRPPDERLSARLVSVVKANPGATVGEVCDVLGVGYATRDEDAEVRREYDNVTQTLIRLAKSGVMKTEGSPRQYTVIGDLAPERQPKDKPKKKRVYLRNPEQAAQFREYMKARRAKLKDEHRCVDCGAGLDEGWTYVKCPECHGGNLETSRRYKKTAKAKQLGREFKKRKYWSDVEAARAERKERYMAKKLAGICQSCSEDAEEDSQYCATHREEANEACRVYRRRARAA